MHLELRVLGGFELRRGGKVVQRWSRAGPRQLLKRLAVSEQLTVNTESLAESLWPGEARSQTMQRLHHQVYLLRKTLQPTEDSERNAPRDSFVRTRESAVQLVIGDELWIDLVEFEQRLSACGGGDESGGEALEKALTLYKGRLLDRETDGGDWLDIRRAQIEARFVAGSHRLAACQSGDGRLQAAVHTLLRLLAHVPCDEAAHRELITLYGRLGWAQDVQRQFDACRAVLQSELDAVPDARTCLAYEAAKALSGSATPPINGGIEVNPPNGAAANQTARWTMPSQLVQLLGRDELSQAAAQHLRRGTRLLSLVGIGGVGKTQLAIRIANEMQRAHRDDPQSACFVPLAQSRPGELYPALARALGLKLPRHEEPERTVWRALEDQRLLLVIDNFEHMLGDAAELTRMMQHCPKLALLVTSRIRLNLAAETCLAVPPLSTHRKGADPPDALKLFIECAQRVRSDLDWHANAIEDATAITQRLGGLPLAIELAAARLPLFSLAELRHAVETSLHVVTGGGADRPTRQRSLRQSFDWSCALLSANAQSLLLMLSLCDTSFERCDAQGLADAGEGDPALEMQHLVEFGFVIRILMQADAENTACLDDRVHNTPFEIAPAIREFVRQDLARHIDRAALRHRFVAHFIRRADALDAEMDAGEPHRVHEALAVFAAQSPNFFAALNAAAEADAQADLCRLTGLLARLWGYRGMWHEAKRWIEQASLQIEAHAPGDRARLMYNICHYWERHGLAARALATVRQAVRFAEAADQPRMLAAALLFSYLLSARDVKVPLNELWSLLRKARPPAARCGDIRLKTLIASSQAMMQFAFGNVRRAAPMLAVCDRRLQRAGDEFARAKISFNLAKVLAYSGRPEVALSSIEEVLARFPSTAPNAVADVYAWAGWFHCCQMNVERARDMTRLARQARGELGSDYLRFTTRLLEGRIAWLAGEFDNAVEWLSSAVFQESTDSEPWAALDAQLWCFKAAIDTGADDIAEKALSRVLTSRQRWPREHPRMLETSAAWLIRQGRCEAASIAWHQAEAIRSRKGIVRFPVDRPMSDQVCAELNRVLGPAWAAERRLKSAAVNSDDPLAWVVDEIARCSRVRSDA
jgi:predicted ATPase/DNA-binding SARP family transcriptional activator